MGRQTLSKPGERESHAQEIRARGTSPAHKHTSHMKRTKSQGDKKTQCHMRQTYSFLLLILNTSFCSSCTKRKNSLIWALIIVDISIILIRSTLMMFFCNFCHDVVNFVIEITFPYKKKKVNVSPNIQYLHNLYNYLFLCRFLFVWCKNFGIISKKKGHKKRKEWPRIILCISLCIQLMLFVCYIFVNPQ